MKDMADDTKLHLTPGDVQVVDGHIAIALSGDRVALMPVQKIIQCAEEADLIKSVPDPDLVSE